MFLYEIFAPGGIDVNETLGHHQFENQREIAFPGGIRPQFIRFAREYDENQRIVRYWINLTFDLVAGESGMPDLICVPGYVCRSSIPRIEWDGSAQAPPLTILADDPMFAPGEPMEDEDGELRPRNVTCFLSPNGKGEAYFFSSNRYVLINVKPWSRKDYIINGPKNFDENWPSLREAKFATVDAVLPHPYNSNQAYFFYFDKYAIIEINPGTTNDRIVAGPKSIAENWPSLKQAGFLTVDAVLPRPDNKNEAYFFKGTQYVRVEINPDTRLDRIVMGPQSIVENWPSLKQVETIKHGRQKGKKILSTKNATTILR